MSLASSSIPFAVTGVVLTAAGLHAMWNALAHAIADQLVGFALIGLAYTVCAGLLVPFVAVPAAASWPFLAASVALHAGYNLLLVVSYRLGDFGQVYPLARGTSPLVVAAVSVGLIGEHLTGVQLAGIVVVSAGLGSLALAGGHPRTTHPGQRTAVVAAVATGLVIAGYTLLDGLGVRRSGSVAGYTGWLFLLQGPIVPLLAAGIRRGRLPGQLRGHARTGLGCGVLSLIAYGLVLWAQTRGALAAVAALRETSVIAGAAIGAIAFHEPFGRTRLLATVLVAAGIIALNIG
jgi:drug/metabolite transporter (DMT)-like permease